ncbi:MAG TPA: class I SAM-dependent methyltransferase, partial [Devosiaceae bacterium]|nr:class I SAM-dependent methyltransferase [Devosiaceae bacterium]
DELAAHWQQVYETKPETGVSWYELEPALSLSLIAEADARPDAAIIDVGGGASRLVDGLLAQGAKDTTVLDLSPAALEVSRHRLGTAGENVKWIAADITRWQPDRVYDVWHDRAVFLFMVTPSGREAFVRALESALRPGGAALIATFAPDGPEKCSGLPVCRYDAESLAAVLGPTFRLIGTLRHEHVTPWGSAQKFQFSTFRKT